MSQTRKLLLSSGCREKAHCTARERKGTAYCIGRPLYPVRGYSDFLFMR